MKVQRNPDDFETSDFGKVQTLTVYLTLKGLFLLYMSNFLGPRMQIINSEWKSEGQGKCRTS